MSPRLSRIFIFAKRLSTSIFTPPKEELDRGFPQVYFQGILIVHYGCALLSSQQRDTIFGDLMSPATGASGHFLVHQSRRFATIVRPFGHYRGLLNSFVANLVIGILRTRVFAGLARHRCVSRSTSRIFRRRSERGKHLAYEYGDVFRLAAGNQSSVADDLAVHPSASGSDGFATVEESLTNLTGWGLVRSSSGLATPPGSNSPS
jgi:hypothetical protein